MNEETRSVIQATFNASNNGSIHFGEVVDQLMVLPWTSPLNDHRKALPMCSMGTQCALPSWARNSAA